MRGSEGRGQIRMGQERPHPGTHCAPREPWGHSRLLLPEYAAPVFGRAVEDATQD